MTLKLPNAVSLARFNIGARLTACFLSIILLMLAGNGLLAWQFRIVRGQGEQLRALDQVLIAVLRFQNSLTSFHDQLNELTQSEDKAQLLANSQGVLTAFVGDTREAETVLSRLPAELRLDPTLLPTLETVQSAVPGHLSAIRALAASGDWPAVRLRLTTQIHPLELLSSELVKSVDASVAAERANATLNIARAERRILFIFLSTALLTALIATLLGAAITRSITGPLDNLVEGSRALARSDFHQHISVNGKDELALLGTVFNDTVGRLQGLYDDLHNREKKLLESEKELRQLIEFVPTHVFILQPDGTGFYANRVVLDYHGFSLEEWRGQKCSIGLIHREDRERYAAELQRGAVNAKPFEAEARVRGKNGDYHWFLSRFNPMEDESGRILRWYVARTDIEEGKREAERARNENLALREEVSRYSMFEEIVGSSDMLRRVLLQVTKVAPSDATVLIQGETGTGKELIARAIHERSARSSRAFIRVNCAALPPALIASELFGHEKGAFTGAVERRLGRFELAQGGTIFLDEIGDLPLEAQTSLLRVLQERELERVGGSQSISVDVRILAATNRNLRAGVAAGIFREDLFYRLNVFPIRVPALRERREDIPLLVEYLIERYSQRAGKKITNIRKSTLELFQSYDWPGNVRELQNVVERAVVLCEGETFTIEETWLKQEASRDARRTVETGRELRRLNPEQEKQIIESALSEAGGRISGPSGAAARLGIPRQTLASKIENLGIDKNRFRNVDSHPA